MNSSSGTASIAPDKSASQLQATAPGGELQIAAIIVTYKTADLAVEGLRSLLAERSTPGLNLRAIVVDNASGDLPTISAAVEREGWSDWVTLMLSPKNGGFAYGNNRGMEGAYATGNPDYFYLLNPDAQVRPGAIGALVRFMQANPQCGIAGSLIENTDGTDWSIAFRFPTLRSEFADGLNFGLVSRLLGNPLVAMTMGSSNAQVDWICGASMMIRPAVIASIGGMDENYFLYYEELDFCRRANDAGFTTWYVPQSRVMHIVGQSTKVTDTRDGLKRLPGYWFASRRRYFAVTFGVAYAMAIDVASLFANTLGWMKRILLGRSDTVVPHFVRDLARNSIVWPRNRAQADVKSHIARSGSGQAADVTYRKEANSPRT